MPILSLLTITTLAVCVATRSHSAVAGDAPTNRVPVIVELFTSEGCSSCPPADALLRKLEAEQPVPNAEIIVLGEHVDYWNSLGWTDRFSSKELTQRQEKYAQTFNLDSAYTPQMVVAGKTELNGADESGARKAIAAATVPAKLLVNVGSSYIFGASFVAEVNIDSEVPVRDANVFLAVTESNLQDTVDKGENKGRVLSHTGVVRKLVNLGPMQGKTFHSSATVRFEEITERLNMTLVAFAQDRKTLRILAAASNKPYPLIKR